MQSLSFRVWTPRGCERRGRFSLGKDVRDVAVADDAARHTFRIGSDLVADLHIRIAGYVG